MIEVTEDAIKALAQAYLAGYADHFSGVTQVYGVTQFEKTRFFRFLRNNYRDHYDYFIVLYDEDAREQWLRDQINSFLGIPPEAQ